MRAPSSILIVRLGALGDIVHAMPAAAALRAAYPAARIDWLVDVKHRRLLDLVPVLTTRIGIDTRAVRGPAGLVAAVRSLRQAQYDVALDLQGLLKSAVLAYASGAERVIGFTAPHLRERGAITFYSQAVDPGAARHVVDRGLALAAAAGAAQDVRTFPFTVPGSDIATRVRALLGLPDDGAYVAINPGAAWPNKRWPADRFGALAASLHARAGLRSVVLWGPGEEELARQVSESSDGAAVVGPSTTLEDLLAILGEARLVISGDTGPLHLAAAAGAPIVGIYGPTDPARNGPWSSNDVTVSRSPVCECFHLRRCRAARWCLLDVSVEEVLDAALRRLETEAGTREPRAGNRKPGAESRESRAESQER